MIFGYADNPASSQMTRVWRNQAQPWTEKREFTFCDGFTHHSVRCASLPDALSYISHVIQDEGQGHVCTEGKAKCCNFVVKFEDFIYKNSIQYFSSHDY